MNIAAYDLVKLKIDKTTSWIDIKHKVLYSHEIINKRFCTFAANFIPSENRYKYFIIMSDNRINKQSELNKEFDSYGRVKIKLYPIWNKTPLKDWEKTDNVSITKVDDQRDGCIYSIDL